MKQKHVYLTDPQIAMLEEISKKEDVSFSEALRGALRVYTKQREAEKNKPNWTIDTPEPTVIG